MNKHETLGWLAPALWVACLVVPAVAGAQDRPIGHPTFLSPHASPIAVSGGHVFVVNTPADTVDVIDASSRAVLTRVRVGIDPVGIAPRPDGDEVWVTNHISDSVSVIDTDPASPTHLRVVATVQDFDPVTRATRFDEPVGVAFAGNDKAYVALSSENQIAVIDVATRQVVRTLAITAQDPRALAVRGDRLYVIPFESNNQTQISGCVGTIDGDLCTFDANEHVVENNNVLSLGIDVDIVQNPKVPDRDLYVFDTTTDELVEVVDTLGTLLYGITVDSVGRVFVAQTDARNDENGRAGTRGDGLAEMQNRAFLNRITRVDCGGSMGGSSCDAPDFIDLEPLPPEHPAPGMALATPFAIQISDDDSTLVVSAAGSNELFTVDAASGAVLGRTDVDAVPRGIALESDGDGQPFRAWVLNAVANTVSLVRVSNPASPNVIATIPLDDPTPPAVKRGRIAFNDADASTTGTFSCESCHPDGHTDQLLWVLDTPICDVEGCTQIPPRSTMPIRGLRDTAPYHWDGIPGDPFGGNNTANIFGNDAPNCTLEEPESCTRFLVDGGLATTMCQVGECPVNDEGKAGAMTGAERDDLAKFLLSVPYPPSQRRSYTNVMSSLAADGFRIFHIDGVPERGGARPNVCGDCHRMPFWVSTNTRGTGMDAPTWRGAYDRWLILPQGRFNVIDLREGPTADNGFPEQSMWGAPDTLWQMALEGSTGFSGSFARQVTLNQVSADAASTSTALTRDLLDALEVSASEGGIVLQGEGVFIDGAKATPVALRFDHQLRGGAYVEREDGGESFTRGELVSLAADGRFVGTFTARLGANVDIDNPQPALWSLGPIQQQRGHQEFLTLSGDNTTMVISGRHIRQGAKLIVDGRRVSGNVRCQGGALPNCADESIVVRLGRLPASAGMHFLQILNPDGLFSNDFIFHSETPPPRVNGPDITVDPLMRDFGEVAVGTSVPTRSVRITNDGTKNLILEPILIRGENRSQFTLPAEKDDCSGTVLRPGSSCLFRVGFEPTATDLQRGVALVRSNDPDEGEVRVVLRGTGGAPPPVSVPDITVDPSMRNFGEVAVGTSAPTRSVRVINDGAKNLVLEPILIRGENRSQFTLPAEKDGCSGTVLRPGGSCLFRVGFEPTATDLQRGVALIRSNDPDEGEVRVLLRGTGE